MANVPKDVCRALGKLFNKLDDEDKDTLNWLLAAHLEANRPTPVRYYETTAKVPVCTCDRYVKANCQVHGHMVAQRCDCLISPNCPLHEAMPK